MASHLADPDGTAQRVLSIDTGWAWVIAFASLGIYSAVAGGFRCLGIIYVEAQEYYESDSPILFWALALPTCVMLLVSPVGTALADKYSYRLSIGCGTLLMSAGLTLTAFVPQARHLIITMTIVHGLGAGLTLGPVLVSTTPYFQKYTNIALGITSMGSGIGQLVLPNILRQLFDLYGFQGGMLLYGGVFLQFFVISLLFRPIQYSDQLGVKESRIQDEGMLSKSPQNDEMPSLETAALENNTEPNASSIPTDLSHNNETKIATNSTVENSISISKKSRMKGIWHSKTVQEHIQAVKSLGLWLTIIVYFIFDLGFSTVSVVIPRYAIEISVNKNMVSYLIGAGGVSEVFSRLLVGAIVHKQYLNVLSLLAMVLALSSALFVMSLSFTNAIGVGIQTTSLGMFASTAYTLQPMILRQELKPELLLVAFGIILAMETPAMFISIPIVDGIIGGSGGSRMAIMFMAICFGAAAIFSGIWVIGKKIFSSRTS